MNMVELSGELSKLEKYALTDYASTRIHNSSCCSSQFVFSIDIASSQTYTPYSYKFALPDFRDVIPPGKYYKNSVMLLVLN